jgi:hypothetical protein
VEPLPCDRPQGGTAVTRAESHPMLGRIVISLVIAFAVASCARQNSPESTGDRFVEAYYVQIDQAQAAEFAAGLARERLQAELQKVMQLRRHDTLAQARPQVSYALARAQPEGRQVLLTYDLTIRPSQVAPILKKILLIMEPVGEQWKVVNFTEADAHP